MTTPTPVRDQCTPERIGISTRLRRDESGAAAVEFAMTAAPFLLFILGIMMTGLHFFTLNSLEHGVENAARQIRTGQAQNGNMTIAQFRQKICTSATAPLKCDNHLKVHIQQADKWADINAVSCLKNDGTLNAGTGIDTDKVSDHTGGASVAVLVTVCYKWDLPAIVPMIPLGNMQDGARLLQASAAFKSEPFN